VTQPTFDLFRLRPSASVTDLAALCDVDRLSDGDVEMLRSAASVSKFALVEHDYIDKDYRNVYSGYYSRKFSRLSSRTSRIHFFDVEISIADLCGPDRALNLSQLLETRLSPSQAVARASTTPGYVGYVIVRPTEYSRIGRCLLDPLKVQPTLSRFHYGVNLAKYSVNILGHNLIVAAFPHQSQDAEAHICAHTAVWSVFRYLSQRYHLYPEIYPYDITTLNPDLSRGRPYPARGLYMDQVTSLFGHYGVGAEQYDLRMLHLLDNGMDGWASVGPAARDTKMIRMDGSSFSKRDLRTMLHLLSLYVESGMPPVVGLPGHAAVAVGVAYSDTPLVKRTKGMYRSSDFAAGVVVNDDNFPPYQLALRSELSLEGVYPRLADEIDSIVVPFPDKIFLTAEKADFLTTDILDPLASLRPSGPSVRRMVCTSSKNYREARLRENDGFTDMVLREPMPHFLWVTEICDLDGWQQDGSVKVEVVLDATAGQSDEAPFLWIRFPRRLLLNENRLRDVANPRAIPRMVKSSKDLHISPLRSNLQYSR